MGWVKSHDLSPSMERGSTKTSTSADIPVDAFGG